MKSKNIKNPINDKSGFDDPCKIKDQIQEDSPKNGINSPWDFRAPSYDQRSSNFINAGVHYGVGVNQPVGHPGNPVFEGVPMGVRTQTTMRVDEKN